MKNYAALAFVGLCMLQGTANGADSCIQTINQGSATVALSMYEMQCASLGWGSGMITKDVRYNCCGPSVVLRINGNDWNKLIEAGKLDGLRYQKFEKGDAYTLTFRKIVGKEPTTINGEDFFK